METSTKAPSGSAWLRLLARSYGWTRYRGLTTEDKMSVQDIAALQERKLRRLLHHAATAVPHYRDAFSDKRIVMNGQPPRELLRELPVLTKQDVAANFPDRILSHGQRSVASKHITSTGTTSDRIDIALDVSSQYSRHGLELWCDDVGGGCQLGAPRAEIPPDACSRECGANALRPARFMDEVKWAASQSGQLPAY